MNNFLKKLGWYPVTTFGWFLTVIYTALLVFVVVKINADLYSSQFELFAVSILSIFFIVLLLFYARLSQKKPFSKNLKKKKK